MPFHRLLKRQLRKSGYPEPEHITDPQFKALLERINVSYYENDEERYTNERANEISSKEMQKLYEQLQRSSESALSAERDKLNRILKNIGYGLLVLDVNDTIIEVNDASLILLKCAAHQLIGRALQDIVVALEPSVNDGNAFTSVPAKLGVTEQSISSFALTKTPLDVANPHHGAVIIFYDISTELQQKAKLIDAKNEAQKANAAKSEFLSRMSHELRTPLHAILGFTQLLDMDSVGFTKLQRDNVAKVDKAGKHLLELINELLDFSRIEAGKITLSIQSIGLADVLSDCLKIVNQQAQSRDIHIDNQLQDMALRVSADALRLKQIFINLLSNAVKYNRVAGTICVSSQVNADSTVTISVSDQGAGMTEAQQALLFSDFQRLDQDGKTEGTGIGLVIAQKLALMMKGKIWLESTPDVGSTFYLSLPLAANNQGE